MMNFLKNLFKSLQDQQNRVIAYGDKNQELYGDKIISINNDTRIVRSQGNIFFQKKSFMGGWEKDNGKNLFKFLDKLI